MAFCSADFLAFFAAAAAVYWLAPPRLRGWVLLALDLWYMDSYGLPSLAVLAAVTAVTWVCGRAIAAAPTQKARRVWLILGLAASAGFLFARKLAETALPGFTPVAAVGLAFYALQAASWLADVYTGRCTGRPGLLRYALYVGFFPRVLSGPIGRAEEFFPQLDAMLAGRRPFDAARARRGLVTMLGGYAQKLLLADLLAVPVAAVFGDPSAHSGAMAALAAVMFVLSLYFDFAGYSGMAIGAAAVLGFDLVPNFRRPLLAQSFNELWQRWHISLSGWLRDYIYIPLGGSRRGRARKYGNLMATFLVSGLWHGNGWQFLVWGAANGALRVADDALAGHCRGRSWVWPRRLAVLLGYAGTMVFFRAPDLPAALSVWRRILTDFHPAALTGEAFLALGLTGVEWAVLLAALAGALLLELLAERLEQRGGSLYGGFCRLPAPLQDVLLAALTTAVLLLACRLAGGDAAGFYYAAF